VRTTNAYRWEGEREGIKKKGGRLRNPTGSNHKKRRRKRRPVSRAGGIKGNHTGG